MLCLTGTKGCYCADTTSSARYNSLVIPASLSSPLMTANLYHSGWTHVCGSYIFPPRLIVQVLKRQNCSQPSHPLLNPAGKMEEDSGYIRLVNIQSQHFLAETFVFFVVNNELGGGQERTGLQKCFLLEATPASGLSSVPFPAVLQLFPLPAMFSSLLLLLGSFSLLPSSCLPFCEACLSPCRQLWAFFCTFPQNVSITPLPFRMLACN